jgi:putative nucleotidyltransferase with HDIG domain
MREIEEYKRQIRGMRDLPTLPVIARRILCLAADDDADAELCEIISSDPALSVRILRVANSAYYGYRARIGTIQEAVLLIGTQMLKQLSLGVMVFAAFKTSQQKRVDFWKDSLMVASIASVLAQDTGASSPELAFMGGLLHKIGLLIIEVYPPENGIMIADHSEVGAWMAERWQLPPELVAAIACYSKPSGAHPEYAPMVACVHIAEAVAKAGACLNGAEIGLEIDFQALGILGLSHEDVLGTAAALRSGGSKLETCFF